MLDPGATFGQVSVLDEPMHDAYAEAMTDSVVRILRVVDLERTIGEHPRMALNLMRSLSSGCGRPRTRSRLWHSARCPRGWPASCWS